MGSELIWGIPWEEGHSISSYRAGSVFSVSSSPQNLMEYLPS